MKDELKKLVGKKEKILFEGKPNKKCFILESIFNPLLPFAIIWALIDGFIFGMAIKTNGFGEMIFTLIIFLIFHMMPVWIYLGGVLLSIKKYENTKYIITDRAIYSSSGVINKVFITKNFAELSNVNLHRGIIDQICNTGDIVTTTSQLNANNQPNTIIINSVVNYTEIYNLVKKLQTDIYTDVMYPNDKRPKENHGYQTDYKG